MSHNESHQELFTYNVDITGKSVYVHNTLPRIPNPKAARFSKVARLNSKMNIIEITANLSKPEQALLITLSKKINRGIYMLPYDLSKLPKNQRSNIYRAYKKLYQKGLVKRISTGLYLINPKIIIPGSNNDEEAANKLWEKLP